jgi:hypothetical protein
MPTRAQVCAWIAGFGLAVPSLALAQDRTEREIVDMIVRDGPQALAIRAETEVIRREQRARLAYPNPGVMYTRESAGFTEFLQVEQLLPVFGTRAALSRAGAAATAIAEADRDARLWRLRSDAIRVTRVPRSPENRAPVSVSTALIQLRRGEAHITFDPATESVNVVMGSAIGRSGRP